VIGAYSAKIKAAFARSEQRRIWSQQNLARVVLEAHVLKRNECHIVILVGQERLQLIAQ